MTTIEIGGLLILVAVGFVSAEGIVSRLPEIWPPLGNGTAWLGVLSSGLLVVFAFVGFEGIVNIAEEVKDPRRTIPKAIFITLAVTTALYILVIWVALVAVGPADLSTAKAPLALVFGRLTGAGAGFMSLIAVVATLNGVIVQIIMASRVTYGLAEKGRLPRWFDAVHPVTRTPLRATAVATGIVLVLALAVPLEGLAEATSRLALVLFVMVNLSLAILRLRETTPPAGIFRAPAWAPWAGLATTAAFLVADVVW
jgi:amino acid transporter